MILFFHHVFFFHCCLVAGFMLEPNIRVVFGTGHTATQHHSLIAIACCFQLTHFTSALLFSSALPLSFLPLFFSFSHCTFLSCVALTLLLQMPPLALCHCTLHCQSASFSSEPAQHFGILGCLSHPLCHLPLPGSLTNMTNWLTS